MAQYFIVSFVFIGGKIVKKWVSISEDYLKALRKVEPRIPFSDYGDDRFKPFFSPLFEIGDLSYVTQVSSVKERHRKMHNQKDFKKVYDSHGQLISVINLNYMFPVPTVILKEVKYKDIDRYRIFKNDDERSAHIHLLKIEMLAINSMNLTYHAKYIYNLKYQKPLDTISMRCFDFKKLEIIAINYLSRIQNESKEYIAV